jgi:hypothetical protein
LPKVALEVKTPTKVVKSSQSRETAAGTNSFQKKSLSVSAPKRNKKLKDVVEIKDI